MNFLTATSIPETGDTCEACGDVLAEGRYVQANAGALLLFCSEDCFRVTARAQRIDLWAERRRLVKRWAIGAAVAVVWLAPHQRQVSQGAPRVHHPIATSPANDVGVQPLPAGWFGPEWPPADVSLLAALGRDSWVHPLAGPFRRMPRADSRVFGAVRPGNRAVECRNGHCGVDLGGEIWGEHIRAVHEGVVDFVQRGPNPDHGGRFVRLAHRNGTVFSWYFHLAAIPRGLERGTPVKGGDIMGLLGDSGVKESAPHLHFAISVRVSKDGAEKYIDPEPLIALWPLRVPIDGSETGLVTTVAETGVPLGSMPLRAGRKAAPKEKRSGSSGRRSPAAPDQEANSADDEPNEGESAPESMPSSDDRSDDRADERPSETPTGD